jgi:nucleolar protein 56
MSLKRITLPILLDNYYKLIIKLGVKLGKKFGGFQKNRAKRQAAKASNIDLLRRKLISKAKEEVAVAYSEKDIHVIKAINVLDDLDSMFNLLSEHCREWYGTHFPELDKTLRDSEAFVKLVYFLGDRKNFSEDKIKEQFANEEAAKEIAEKASKSMGSAIEAKRLDELKLLALNALNLREERKSVEKFVEQEIAALAPNLSKVAGSLLAARLLAKAGSLQRLAEMPSSTMQLVGAEKALFRYLKNKRKGRGPKHGLVFAHPLVKQAGRKNAGKMARTLAGKLSIAAKADYFSKQDISGQLLKSLEARARQLQQKA